MSCEVVHLRRGACLLGLLAAASGAWAVTSEDQATLGEFLSAVRSNWAGEEVLRLRGLAMAAPYWGDNSEASTSLMRRWNIIVKVCGFSARFVTLSKRWQDEIIARHRLK